MRKLVVFHITALLILIATGNGHTQSSESWQTLFNGTNLEGWSLVDPPINVGVQAESMILHMTANTSRHSFIRTNEEYEDFILEMDFKRDRALDSGVLFRSEATPDSAFSALFGYMVKIDPRPSRLWTGGVFVDYGNSYSWLHTLKNNDLGRQAEKKEGEWNHLRVEAIGKEIKVWLNGVSTAHLIDDHYKRGFIGFKVHYLNNSDKEKEQLEIGFKNIKVMTTDLEKYTRAIALDAQDTRGELDITYFK